MYDLEKFTLKDTTECGAALRKLSTGAVCMEDVAARTVKLLFENLSAGGKKEPAVALVRFFITQPYAALEPSLQKVIAEKGNLQIAGEAPCLVLLASAGVRPEWNSRHTSKNHRAIALTDPHLREQYPMLAQFVAQFDGRDKTDRSQQPVVLVDDRQKSYNIFYVADAMNADDMIPDQKQFVVPHHIRSVVGFGGMLPSGSLFGVAIFSRVPISRHTALGFRPFALNTKIALLPFDDSDSVFTRS